MSKLALTGGMLPLLLVFTSLADPGYRTPVANGVPRPDHVVIVIEENHSYSEIIGSSAAPYISSLAAQVVPWRAVVGRTRLNALAKETLL